MFKLTNLRLGFATNSSSSHSITFGPDLMDYHEVDYCFGWEHFVAKKFKAKLLYFAISLFKSIDHDTDWREGKFRINEAFDFVIQCYPEIQNIPDWREILESGGVDHQSHVMCPLYLDDRPAIEFYRVLTMPIIKAKDIAIEGGNDNVPEPLLGRPIDVYLIESFTDSKWRIRDEDFGWIVFNEYYGTKLTLEYEEVKECIDQSLSI